MVHQVKLGIYKLFLFVMKTNSFLLIALVAICSCVGPNTSKDQNNQVAYFNLTDSIVLKSYDGRPFSHYLLPLEFSDSNFVALDELTQSFVSLNGTQHNIEPSVIDIMSSLQKYKGLQSGFVGAIRVEHNRYLLCSNPYFLVVDTLANVYNEQNFKFEFDGEAFNVAGNSLNLRFDKEQNNLYAPILPAIPCNHDKYFNYGRIARFNIESGDMSVLPAGLPADYKPLNSYELFSLPLFEIVDNKLLYIFPGSKWLYSIDMGNNVKDSVFISPQNADINSKSVNCVREMMTAYFGCSNWYRLLSDGNTTLLFYWKGKPKEEIKRREGLKGMECFVLGFDINKNKILFDQPFDITGCMKNPLLFNDNILYFTKEVEEVSYEFIAKIVGYEVAIKDN